MNRTLSAIVGLGLTVLLAQASPVTAAEIKIWTARALATVLAEVGPQFESTTGHKLAVSSGLPPEFASRANAGEPFDIMITGSPPLDRFIKEGRIIAETRTDIARSGIGVEVRAGARKPDISWVWLFCNDASNPGCSVSSLAWSCSQAFPPETICSSGRALGSSENLAW